MGHNCLLLVLTVLVPLMFVVAMVFNGLGSQSTDIGLYVSSTSELSDKYQLEITPAGWTFSIWGVIYTWQALWIVYAIVNLFRKTEEGKPFYTHPVLLSAPFLGIYIFNLMLNCTWLVTFDREFLEVSCAVLFLMCVTLYACLFISYRNLDRNMDVLVKENRKTDVWLTRLFVQNALGIYATWCSIATLLNLGFVLTYRSAHDIGQRNASTIVLGILTAGILVFLVTDFAFLDRYTRYTFTPYIVLVMALSGSLSKNYEEGARNSIFTVALLALAVVAAIVKCFLLFWRHFKHTTEGVKISSDGYKV